MTEDLKLKVGTKQEAVWTKVKDLQEQRFEELKVELVIAEEVLKLAKERIENEQKN